MAEELRKGRRSPRGQRQRDRSTSESGAAARRKVKDVRALKNDIEGLEREVMVQADALKRTADSAVPKQGEFVEVWDGRAWVLAHVDSVAPSIVGNASFRDDGKVDHIGRSPSNTDVLGEGNVDCHTTAGSVAASSIVGEHDVSSIRLQDSEGPLELPSFETMLGSCEEIPGLPPGSYRGLQVDVGDRVRVWHFEAQKWVNGTVAEVLAEDRRGNSSDGRIFSVGSAKVILRQGQGDTTELMIQPHEVVSTRFQPAGPAWVGQMRNSMQDFIGSHDYPQRKASTDSDKWLVPVDYSARASRTRISGRLDLRVTILGTTGLLNVYDAICACGIPHKPHQWFTTSPSVSSSWHHSDVLTRCALDDDLHFKIQSNCDDLIATGILSAKHIYPNGFHGDISLADGRSGVALDSSLRVKIELLPTRRFDDTRRLFVKIREANRVTLLAGQGDLHCVVSVPGRPTGAIKTKSVRKCSTPCWNEEAEVSDWCVGDELQISLMDRSSDGNETVLGTALFESSELRTDGLVGTRVLRDATDHASQSTISVTIFVEHFALDSARKDDLTSGSCQETPSLGDADGAIDWSPIDAPYPEETKRLEPSDKMDKTGIGKREEIDYSEGVPLVAGGEDELVNATTKCLPEAHVLHEEGSGRVTPVDAEKDIAWPLDSGGADCVSSMVDEADELDSATAGGAEHDSAHRTDVPSRETNSLEQGTPCHVVDDLEDKAKDVDTSEHAVSIPACTLVVDSTDQRSLDAPIGARSVSDAGDVNTLGDVGGLGVAGCCDGGDGGRERAREEHVSQVSALSVAPQGLARRAARNEVDRSNDQGSSVVGIAIVSQESVHERRHELSPHQMPISSRDHEIRLQRLAAAQVLAEQEATMMAEVVEAAEQADADARATANACTRAESAALVVRSARRAAKELEAEVYPRAETLLSTADATWAKAHPSVSDGACMYDVDRALQAVVVATVEARACARATAMARICAQEAAGSVDDFFRTAAGSEAQVSPHDAALTTRKVSRAVKEAKVQARATAAARMRAEDAVRVVERAAEEAETIEANARSVLLATMRSSASQSQHQHQHQQHQQKVGSGRLPPPSSQTYQVSKQPCDTHHSVHHEARWIDPRTVSSPRMIHAARDSIKAVIHELIEENRQLHRLLFWKGITGHRVDEHVENRVFGVERAIQDNPADWFTGMIEIVDDLRSENADLHAAHMQADTETGYIAGGSSDPVASAYDPGQWGCSSIDLPTVRREFPGYVSASQDTGEFLPACRGLWAR
eukprot:TRINITY_DN13647_c0_g1_i1.p1 TRINITY_DN13647_c0_g1~~TRINITY_DN13647_c0_g1_i1.p1  ORF type:complete len:1398 (-),score=195.08 TRINITY_DN13647_c0_g1_i1:474-4280(-)